jgi:acetylornithine deacetylase
VALLAQEDLVEREQVHGATVVTARGAVNRDAVRMSELTNLIADLVRIDSVNPGLVEGGAGEARIAAFVASWLERAGLDVTVEEALPGRPNVVGVRRGSGGGRTLLLNGHMDVVGAGRMAEPFVPRVAGGRLHGRGAYDMKAGLAAAMLAAAALDGLAGDVVVTAVCDEELGGAGTRALVESGLRADGAIVTEPTGLVVGLAHKGFVGFRIETTGVAAHGSMPHLGHDAIAEMGPVLVALRELDARLQSAPPHPLLGTASLHASLIAGGQEFSSYPASCVLHGEVRTVPGMPDPEALLAAVAGSAELSIEVTGDAMETAPDATIAQLVLTHAGTSSSSFPFWTDAAQLAAAGIPTVLFGPDGTGAHADDEHVDLASAHRVGEVLTAVARDFCAG